MVNWRSCNWVIHAAAVLVFSLVLILNPSYTQAGTPDDSYTIERYYAENDTTTDTNSTTTPQQAIYITFTPPATKYYLVLASCLTNNTLNGEYTQTQLVIDSTVYSVAQHAPVDTNNNWRSHATHKIIQLDNTSHTIEWEFFTETGSGTAQVKKLRIAVIEISNYYYGEDDTETNTTSSSYVEKTTTGSFTPPATADYLGLATINQKNDQPPRNSQAQFTVDEVQEDEAVHYGASYSSYAGFTKESLDNSSHNLDIDYKRGGAGKAYSQHAHVAAVLLSDLGTENGYSESLTESPNTTTTYSTKTTLNITPTERGDYLVIAMALGNLTDTADVFDADLDLDSGTSLGTFIYVTGDAVAYNSFFVVKKVNLTAASHTIIMQWRRGTNSTGSGTANIKSSKIIAIRVNTAESYNDSGHTTVDDDFTSGETTAYIWAHGLRASNTYAVAYYDGDATGGGQKVATNSGLTSTAYGNLSSQYLLTTDPSATPGTWHAVVFDSEFGSPPTNYNDVATTAGYVVEDSFTVDAAAIPEFPTVIAGIIVVGLCFGIYYWMRKRRLAYDKA